MHSSSQGGKSGGVSSRWWGVLLSVIAASWLFLVSWDLLILPAPVELDPSWQAVLEYAAAHDFRPGVDYTFTHGPLSYLRATHSIGLLSGQIAFYQTGHALLLALCWLVLCLRLRPLPIVLVSLSFIAAIALFPSIDLQDNALLLLVNFLWVRETLLNRNRWTGITAGLLAAAVTVILSFGKFLVLATGAAVWGGAAMILLWEWRRAKWIPLVPFAWLVLLSTGWLFLGHRLGDFPTFLWNALDVARGFTPAMYIFVNPSVLNWSLCLLVLWGLFGIVSLLAAHLARWPALIIWCGSLSFVAFVSFKHTFVRFGNSQSLNLSVTVIIATLLLYLVAQLLYQRTAETPDTPALPPWRAFLLRFHPVFCGLLVSFALLASLLPLSSLQREDIKKKALTPLNPAAQFAKNLPWLLDTRNKTAELRREAEELAFLHSPEVAALPQLFAGEPVDVFIHNQALATLLPGVDYCPRPLFQSYSAYTPHLIDLNAEFYASPQRPEFVLYRTEYIDRRFPHQADSLAFLRLLTDYQPVGLAGGQLVLRHQGDAPADLSAIRKLVLETDLKLGHKLDIAHLSEKPLWVEMDFEPSAIYKLRKLFYQPYPVELQVGLMQSEGKKKYRLVPEIAEHGFLLSPLVLHNWEYALLADGVAAEHPGRVTSLKLQVDKNLRKAMGRTVRIRLYEITEPFGDPGSTNAREVFTQNLFPVVPAEISTDYAGSVPVLTLPTETTTALMLQPPGKVRLPLPAGVTTVSGEFGIAEIAYTPPNSTDGVTFILEMDGEEIWQRHLDPMKNAADQGMHSFEITLPPRTQPAEIILRTEAGPAGDTAGDWGLWRNIRYDRADESGNPVQNLQNLVP